MHLDVSVQPVFTPCPRFLYSSARYRADAMILDGRRNDTSESFLLFGVKAVTLSCNVYHVSYLAPISQNRI